MSVFTIVTPAQLAAWLKNYSIGGLVKLEGIVSGIENTNYFVTTTHARYVLTLFEKLTASELPFYMNLMSHLARHGLPCPQPIADLGNEFVGELNGKPASIVTCVPGADLKIVDARQCAIIGGLLAELHLAGQSYAATTPNPRGAQWWATTMPQVTPFLDARAASMLRDEVRFQSQLPPGNLPRGAIHADLFRDNVLWNGAQVGGVIDFYFACTDALLYDVAITVNDWCRTSSHTLDGQRAQALIGAYHSVRPFTAGERDAWPRMLRAGALRFWVSRLHDMHLPRPGTLVHAKDPVNLQHLLEQHIAREAELKEMFVPV